jgi:hypothetical protein
MVGDVTNKGLRADQAGKLPGPAARHAVRQWPIPAGAAGLGSLIPKLRAGSAPVPEEMIRRHAARVHALACRLLGTEAAVEDVTRQVLLQVVRQPAAALSAWLHRATVNAALLHRRQANLAGV